MGPLGGGKGGCDGGEGLKTKQKHDLKGFWGKKKIEGGVRWG